MAAQPGLPTLARPFSFTAYDRSLVLNGADQIPAPAGPGKRVYLMVFNGALHPVGVNVTGGVASIGGLGTITIQPGGFKEWFHAVPSNDIHVTGTNGDILCVIEG